MIFSSIDFLVIDNTALVSGFNLNLVMSQNPDLKLFMTYEVYSEAEKNPKSTLILQIAETQGILQVRDPVPESLERVMEIAMKSGDRGALSQPDMSLIALSHELMGEHPGMNVVLMSDDYSLQNTCAFFSPPIPTYSYSKAGIKKKYQWRVYCPFCKQSFSPDKLGQLCPDCGVELKRKKKKKNRSKKK